MNRVKNLKIFSITIFAFFALLFLPFWKSISISMIFAFFIYPYLCYHTKNKKGINKKIVIAAVSLTTLFILTPLFLGAYSVSTEVVEFSKEDSDNKMLTPNNLKNLISNKTQEISKTLKIPQTKWSNQMIEKMSSAAGDWIFKYSTDFLIALPQFAIEIIIFTLGLYVFLFYGRDIKAHLLLWNVFDKKDLNELVQVLNRGCHQCILSLLIVGTIQAMVVVIGAAIAGYSKLLTIFLLTFTLSFIPVIGAAPVGFLLALLKLVEGKWEMGIFLFIVGCLAGIIDNIVKPLLIGRGIDLDGAVGLIIIIGALVIFGLPGLFIGPIIGTTATYYFNKAEKEKGFLIDDAKEEE